MGITPELPDGTPTRVNGWVYDPEPYNGNAWMASDRDLTVHVQPLLDETAIVRLQDGRLDDDCTAAHRLLDHDAEATYEEAVAFATSWMSETAPADWEHPAVTDAVFNAPDGWELQWYGLGPQQTRIRYELEESPDDLSAVRVHVEGYRSTDNWTVGFLRHPVDTGQRARDQAVYDPPKGTPLEEVLGDVRRLARAMEPCHSRAFSDVRQHFPSQ